MPHKDPSRWPADERCQAITKGDRWTRSQRCVNRCHVRINKKDLCNKHAAVEALSILIRAGSVTVLHRPIPNRDGVKVEA